MTNAPKASVSIKGIAVSPGIHIGRVVIHDSFLPAEPLRRISASKVKQEIVALDAAMGRAKTEISGLRAKISATLDEAHAAIFDPHLLFLEDPAFRQRVVERIRERRQGADYAVLGVIQELARQFEAMKDEYISSRSSDILDVGNRIARQLSSNGRPVEEHPSPAEDIIVFARDLSPSDTAQMDHRRVKAFAMEIGGPTSHTAILAKGLEIPAVVGLGALLHHVDGPTMAIVDGYEGFVVVNPTADDIRSAKARRRRHQVKERSLQKLRRLPAETIDGYRVELSANLEFPEEIPHVLDHGAAGVGLFRTEFLYFHHADWPSEEDQFQLYRKVLESIAPNSVIFRTLDVGGDKFFSELSIRDEQNPFLGLRAIRFCLENPAVFKTQLRALLRASAFGRAKIMFPMVSSIKELRAARKLLDEARGELDSEGIAFDPKIEIGIMIEIPSAALTADQFASEVDFFSIGTNDLIQYTLAVDRANERVASLYDPCHPAVLRLIRMSVDAAHRAGIWVGVCGEMAANPQMALLLVGMGIDELSMGALSIPGIKFLIRNIRLSEARRLASEIQPLGSSQEIRDHIEQAFRRLKRTRA